MRLSRKSLGVWSICFAAMGWPTAAFAGGTQVGNVVKIAYLTGGQVLVYLSGTATGQPACATQPRFAIDSSTSGGKAMIKQVISLYNNRQQALIQGTGGCTIWADTEDVLILWTPGS